MRRLLSILVLLFSAASASAEITICTEPDPPPWSYWVRDKDGRQTGEVAGAGLDLARSVFAALGDKVRIIANVPWARCLKRVETGEFDFVLDASFDPERTSRFVFSRHYGTLTPQIFMSASRPVDIRTTDDLKRFRGCGISGSGYGEYGLKESDLETSDVDYAALVKKLKAGHCDYFPEDLEWIAGYRMLGRDYLADPDLRHIAIKGTVPTTLHLMAGHNSRAAAMLKKVDAELDRLIDSGEAARIWAKHAGDLPYVP